eukprot:6854475-Lingulodinium_polyedra.AAC.1
MAEVRFSTTVLEQGHGSAAMVHRHHKDYSSETLVKRAMLHMCRQLIPKAQEDYSVFDKIQAQISAIKMRKPSRVSGRQIFLQELFEDFKLHVQGQDRKQVATLIMKEHGKRWAALSGEEQAHYNALAKGHTATSNWKNHHELQELLHSKALEEE